MTAGFHSPKKLSAAMDLLGMTGIQILAGGTDVFPTFGPGSSARSFLDLTRIDGLRGISRENSKTIIGATTTWSDIVRADLPPAFDGLRASAREVGSLQIQNTGTIGGNLCNASPAADGVPALLTLDASVELSSAAQGRRVLPLSEFILGVRRTALRGDELLTAIILPDIAPTARSAFVKLGARRYMVISIAMVAALVECDAAGRIVMARVAVGACSPVAQRLPLVEAAVIGLLPSQIRIGPEMLAPLSPIDDLRGTAGYRIDAVAELCARVIRTAAGDDRN